MKVLIADKFEDAGLAQLKQAGCEITFDPELKEASLLKALEAIRPAVLVVRSTKVTAQMLGAAAELKLVLRAGSGVNTIDVANATQRGIRVANCPGMNATAVAELAFGLILALDRRIVDNVNDLRRGVWNKKEYGKARGLKGRTLGIVGIGQIGRLLALRALAFEMRILYYDVIPCEALDGREEVRRVELEPLLERADIVTLHVPELPETIGMINDERLALMQPHAYLINTCRGKVVDEAALIRALKGGRIAAAALDVYENEPSSATGAFAGGLAELPNFYGTHHIGASTEQAQSAVAAEAVRIIQAFNASGNVLHCVNG